MNGWDIVFQVIGGLGVFMLGMRYMSDGLQTVSGPLLRTMIGFATTNRFLATSVGVLVTMVVQSSTITTVITVGLVNSGIMKLQQALGVILGANIGTTLTGWILIIKIGKFGLPILGVFALIFLFSKYEKVKYVAMVLMGVGMIFFGLDLISNGLKPISEMPELKKYFVMFSTDTYAGVMGCALIGCLVTLTIQSSSATLAITLAMAGTGLIDMRVAAALVLGENVGTTATALFSSIGTSTNAKRTAYFHALFNFLGVLWVTALFSFIIPHTESVVKYVMSIDSFDRQYLHNGEMIYSNRQIFISSIHSLFNIVNVIIFLPLLGFFNMVLMKYVKETKQTKKLLTRLEYRVGDNPFVQIEQSKAEVEKMGMHTKEMIENLRKYCTATEKEKKQLCKAIFERERILDSVQKEIIAFLTMVMKENLSDEMAIEFRGHLILTDEFESISDYAAQILKLKLRLEEHGLTLNEGQIEDIQKLLNDILHCFEHISSLAYDSNRKERLIKVTTESKEIIEHIRAMRSKHWDYASQSHLDALLVTTYSDMLVAFRKIIRHLISSAEAIAAEEF